MENVLLLMKKNSISVTEARKLLSKEDDVAFLEEIRYEEFKQNVEAGLWGNNDNS